MIQTLKPKSIHRFLHYSPSSVRGFVAIPEWISALTPSRSSRLQETPFPGSLRNHRTCEHFLLSAMKSCASDSDIFRGRQIHCNVLKSGLVSNYFVLNSLTNLYARCGCLEEAEVMFRSSGELDMVSCNIMLCGYVRSGKLDDARKLFDEMSSRSCVSYTTMMMGFSKNDQWNETIEMFKAMMDAGVIPNEVTMGNVISAASHLGDIWECKMLHGLIVKMMLHGFVLVSTNLLHMYCGCLSLEEARALFDEMEEKNMVTWNVMLNGYSKAGLMDLARGLLERIPDKDVFSWGTIIDGYIRVEKWDEAMSMYCSMISTGFRATEVMMVDLVSACSKNAAISEGQQLHSVVVKAGFDRYNIVQAVIIHLYASCGRLKEACLQFDSGIGDHVDSCNALMAGFMRNKRIDLASELFRKMHEKDVISWSTMIAGYTQNGHPKMALQLFDEMVHSGIQPNEVTMVSVFSAIAALGTLQKGRWAHAYVNAYAIYLSDNLSAAIIDMYAKCGSIASALDVFYQIREKVSTVSPWNAIICGLAMHGDANLALQVYSDLLRRPIKLAAITFIGVLSACCHAGLVELGKKYFQSMKHEHHIEPDIRHYGCMVDLLGRAGKLEDAEETIRSMPMKADVSIWGTLLAACRTHGNVDVGERAAEILASLDPSHGSSRVLLCNMYADAERWNDAFSVRRTMQSQKMQRLPGYSAAAPIVSTPPMLSKARASSSSFHCPNPLLSLFSTSEFTSNTHEGVQTTIRFTKPET